MDVVCSRCQLTIVATIPDEAAAPAGGLGICGPCGDIVNAARHAALKGLLGL